MRGKDSLTFVLHPKQLVAFRSKATETLYGSANREKRPVLSWSGWRQGLANASIQNIFRPGRFSDEDIAQRKHCSFHCTGFCKRRQGFLCPNHKQNYRPTAYCCSQLGSRSAPVWESSFEPLPIEEHSLQQG
jgi:hypothetical protein